MMRGSRRGCVRLRVSPSACSGSLAASCWPTFQVQEDFIKEKVVVSAAQNTKPSL